MLQNLDIRTVRVGSIAWLGLFASVQPQRKTNKQNGSHESNQIRSGTKDDVGTRKEVPNRSGENSCMGERRIDQQGGVGVCESGAKRGNAKKYEKESATAHVCVNENAAQGKPEDDTQQRGYELRS